MLVSKPDVISRLDLRHRAGLCRSLQRSLLSLFNFAVFFARHSFVLNYAMLSLRLQTPRLVWHNQTHWKRRYRAGPQQEFFGGEPTDHAWTSRSRITIFGESAGVLLTGC